MVPLSLGNIILLKDKGGMRESFSRQVDKKSKSQRRRGRGRRRRRKESRALKEKRTNLVFYFALS